MESSHRWDREAALELIADAGDVEQAPRLAALMASARDEDAARFATALGRLADPRVEDDLLRLLGRDAEAVQCAAAVALGRPGSVRAVEPLLPLTEALLRAAVAAIQARLGDAEAGRLSLVDDPRGKLSLGENAACRAAQALVEPGSES